MRRARTGDLVTVHYIGTLDNGRIFDQRTDDLPLTFTIGAGEVFPAFERDIIGMAVGDVKNIFLSAEQAFGLRLDANLLRVPRTLFPTGQELQIGRKLEICLADNARCAMRVRSFDEREVLLDGNHELAGCDLTFAMQLVKIEEDVEE